MRVFQLRSCGTERAARPCSFDCDGSAQACDIHIDGAVERSEFDADIPAVPASTQAVYWGNHFWSKGHCVDTVGLDADMIRKYVRYQEKKEQLMEQLQLID
jgi:hypothetical protein